MYEIVVCTACMIKHWSNKLTLPLIPGAPWSPETEKECVSRKHGSGFFSSYIHDD